MTATHPPIALCDGDDERLPPQDLHAEQAVLGALMLSKDAIADVIEHLRPTDFYRPAHEQIYTCILEFFSNGEPADAVTVAAALERHGTLHRVGGAPYLHTLIATVPTAANAGYYAEIVSEKAVQRRLVQAGTRIAQMGYHGAAGGPAELIDRAQSEVFGVAQLQTSQDYAPIGRLLQPALDELDAIACAGGVGQSGVPTGFHDLDKVTHGLPRGALITVAARPGVGKSTLAMDFIRNCAIRHNQSAAIFSLEMSQSEIVMRILSAESGVKLADMRAGTMTDNDWTRVAQCMSRVSDAPLFIDDSPNLTLMEIRAKARRLKQQHNLRLLVIDYLQLMTSGKRVESRQHEVAEFSRSLKLLAKDLDIPVVAVSQLNRGPEQRVDKRPQVSDLRESGAIEQDCDIVILLHRPDAIDRDDPRAGEADIHLAKHRNGPTAVITVSHQLHICKMSDMART